PEKPFNQPMQHCYRALCDCWAVPEMAGLEAFVGSLKQAGFRNIQVRDIFWNVFPSGLHIPLALVRHILKQWMRLKPIGRQNWRHLRACFLAMFLGLYRSKFGYYIITGTK
ncbi:MAG: hypothetical protein AAGB22_12415, partial [Bacteroidota bacterium]